MKRKIVWMTRIPLNRSTVLPGVRGAGVLGVSHPVPLQNYRPVVVALLGRTLHPLQSAKARGEVVGDVDLENVARMVPLQLRAE